MAERTYKRPREFFGVGSKPLLGSENPMISDSVQQRFNRAGLGSFVPYVDPFETVAKTRALRNMDRDIRLQDQVEDAEMGFMEAIRQDPKTGYQKFLQSNPMATLSPMVRAYAATQGRFGDTQSKREEQVAELGAPYLQTYRKGLKGGKDEIEAFADAVSQREQDVAKAKMLKPGEDDRLTLTGTPREEFDSIMSAIASAPEPTDEEKIAFLPPGKKEYTPAEWSDAYTKAREKSRADAISKLRNFQQIYGQSYQVPGVPRGGFAAPSPQAAPVSPWPAAAPTSFGETSTIPQTAATATIPRKVMGYDVRDPFSGEDAYFKSNPNVAGMAGEDGKITLNPYSKLSPQEMSSVAENEAFRLKMRDMNYIPQFSLTPQQEKMLSGSEYSKNPAAAKQTILARILSGDPSVGSITEDQRREADAFRIRATSPRASEFNFPTLGDDMAPSPTRQAVQSVKDAVGNVVSNVKFDPAQALAAAVQPGGVQTMAAIPAPTTDQQNQEWTSAKQKVRDFIDKIPGDDQQKLKVLGSLLTEQPIPHDFFTKEKAKDDRIAYVPAGSALQDALREADPKLGRFALKDKDGTREWADVARVVAQEEMAKRGLVKTPASPSSSQPSQVTTRAQYDALPSGTRYVDSNGRVAVKK